MWGYHNHFVLLLVLSSKHIALGLTFLLYVERIEKRLRIFIMPLAHQANVEASGGCRLEELTWLPVTDVVILV
jgi:hypothetical protein